MLKKDKETKKTEQKKTAKQPSYYQGVGRRKESDAVVRLFIAGGEGVSIRGKTLKKGEMIVNARPIEQYFSGEIDKKLYIEPFRTTNTVERFVVSAVIKGGGHTSQLNAFIHGVSRALEKVDKEKFRPVLKKKGFLTRDDRIKQRRKAGYAQKSRARKQSPKR